MLNVPKKANDAMHLSMLDGCDISVDMLGEVVLQDMFQVIMKIVLKRLLSSSEKSRLYEERGTISFRSDAGLWSVGGNF